MLGLYLFFKGLRSKSLVLSLSFLSFGISLLTYHSAKIVVPPILILLLALYFKDLIKSKKYFILGLTFLAVVGALMLVNKNLLGLERFRQTSFKEKSQGETINRVVAQYLSHFSYSYLFVSGDKNARLSSQGAGEFYLPDLPFLVVGALVVLWLTAFKKSKPALVLISWALIAPLPAAAVSEAPHAARAMFMTGSWHIISALGFYSILTIFKNKFIKAFALTVSLIVLGYFLKNYLFDYYQNYAKRYAIEWQYGMKEIVKFAERNDRYFKVYMTNIRQQPYIFFLYYLKTPLPELLATAKYDTSLARSFSTVRSFDRYQFGGWDTVESTPSREILYIVQPSDYTGLRLKEVFDVAYLIKYPNGSNAFYLVSGR